MVVSCVSNVWHKESSSRSDDDDDPAPIDVVVFFFSSLSFLIYLFHTLFTSGMDNLKRWLALVISPLLSLPFVRFLRASRRWATTLSLPSSLLLNVMTDGSMSIIDRMVGLTYSNLLSTIFFRFLRFVFRANFGRNCFRYFSYTPQSRQQCWFTWFMKNSIKLCLVLVCHVPRWDSGLQ